MRQVRAVLQLCLLVPLAAMSQASADRLLPESFTRAVQFDWRQDGRVVEISLRNPKDKWLITEATFTAHPQGAVAPAVVSKADGKRQPKNGALGQPTLDDLLASGVRYATATEPSTKVLKVHVMPAEVASTHVELDTSAPILALTLDETRGREPTAFERVRTTVR